MRLSQRRIIRGSAILADFNVKQIGELRKHSELETTQVVESGSRMEFSMAPRAYWKGYLKLSLVSCPILLYPATSEREKIRFHQINKETGNRVRYKKVDEGTGDEVEQG